MRFSVTVPASSANLGPGFDALAVAIDLPLRIDVVQMPAGGSRRVGGPDLGGGEDLVLAGMRQAARLAERELPACQVSVRADIPVARGLGSSAAALVGGLLVGNHLLGNPLDEDAILRLGTAVEGHGDNVAAALYGGVVVVVRDGERVVAHRVPLAVEPRATLFVPDRAGLTRDARAVLPAEIPRADAVANAARCALLVLALGSGELDLLGLAMDDRLHQPYRTMLYPYLPEMIAAARASGAYGASLSGAGPSVLALVAPERAAAVAAAMADVASRYHLGGTSLDVPLATAGARVEAAELLPHD
ncbi:MAG TPA: homoserine kinase [Thermomicrobiaceae bacterium]|nr:homoserine kinase [Thermomicrobiaceae bacterium]